MLITVSGPPGSGTSTVAGRLAGEFDYDYVSGGDLFRALAEERGCTLAEFNERAESDDQIDRDLDRQLRETARTREDTILESRLAGWMAGEHADLKVWLDAPIGVRAARIADREGKSPDQARTETERRERSERERYRAYYGIEFGNLSIYDLTLNTARWDIAGMTEIVSSAVRAYDPAVDEGAVPVDGVSYEF